MTTAAKILRGRAEEILPTLDAESFDLIHADPPYFRVLAEDWDRQWKTRDAFLEWLGSILDEFRRLLKPNGSLYVWASSEMAAAVEEWVVRPRFAVLSSIVWKKSDSTNRRCSREELRAYLAETERCVFAEHYGTDERAAGEAGFIAAERALKKRIFGDYLSGEMERAGATQGDLAALFPSVSGGLTGCVTNWRQGFNCPTAAQWTAIRERLNVAGGQFLRRDYEELRRDYEELRRPFFVSERVVHTDVWEYESAERGAGRHPAEKPIDMMRDIVRTSTRDGALVLDAFAGSGSMSAACVELGRSVVAVEMDADLCRDIERRIDRHAAAKSGELHRVEMASITGPLFEGALP